MAIDWSAIAAAGGFGKGQPRVLVKKAKDRKAAAAWTKTRETVDGRDKKQCQITGKPVSAGAVDPWRRLERHHIEYRSKNKTRIHDDANVITTSAAVSQLIHAGVLKLLDKRGLPAKSVAGLDSVQWDRTRAPKGSEPCRIRKGLAVSERRPS